MTAKSDTGRQDAGRRPRLLVVSGFFPPHGVGGAEIVALRQARMAQARGWDVEVFTRDVAQLEGRLGVVSREVFEGVPVLRAAVKRKRKYAFFNPSAEAPFAKTLSEFAPDVVHLHHLYGLGFALIEQARRSGARVVVTLHDRWAFCFKGTLLRNDLAACSDFEACELCARAIATPDGRLAPRLRSDYAMTLLNSADALISPSRQLAADFVRAGVDPGRIEMLSSGVDLERIVRRPRVGGATVLFLCAAQLDEHKGVRVLAAALKLLGAQEDLRARWSMLVAGDGPLASWLAETVAAEGLSTAVELPGRLTNADLLARLGECDVVVLPSICSENQPVSLLEGLASGAALIASRVDGNVELIDDGLNGRLYARDDPTALAAAMRELILSPERLAAFSAANLARRGEFDQSTTGAALDRLYRAASRPVPQADPTLAFGLGRAGGGALASAPRRWRGRRLRLVWWRWSETLRERPPLWVAALSARPDHWARAAWRWGLTALAPRGPALPAPFMEARADPQSAGGVRQNDRAQP